MKKKTILWKKYLIHKVFLNRFYWDLMILGFHNDFPSGVYRKPVESAGLLKTNGVTRWMIFNCLKAGCCPPSATKYHSWIILDSSKFKWGFLSYEVILSCFNNSIRQYGRHYIASPWFAILERKKLHWTTSDHFGVQGPSLPRSKEGSLYVCVYNWYIFMLFFSSDFRLVMKSRDVFFVLIGW